MMKTTNHNVLCQWISFPTLLMLINNGAKVECRVLRKRGGGFVPVSIGDGDEDEDQGQIYGTIIGFVILFACICAVRICCHNFGRKGNLQDAVAPTQKAQISIPKGTQPGEKFRAEIGSRVFMIRCPENAKPGQMISVTLPENPKTTNNSDNEKEDDKRNADGAQKKCAGEKDTTETTQITIPKGIQPGDNFRALVGRRVVKVQCPDNAEPGQMLSITLPPEPKTTTSSKYSLDPLIKEAFFQAMQQAQNEEGAIPHKFEKTEFTRKVEKQFISDFKTNQEQYQEVLNAVKEAFAGQQSSGCVSRQIAAQFKNSYMKSSDLSYPVIEAILSQIADKANLPFPEVMVEGTLTYHDNSGVYVDGVRMFLFVRK